MIQIRIRCPFRFDHCEIPAGTVIAVPAAIAQDFCRRGIAVIAEPERAVVEVPEVRAEVTKPKAKYRRRKKA